MSCWYKLTEFQPTDEEWLCPRCGASNENFAVCDSSCGCDMLHDGDEVKCDRCSTEWSGKELAEEMVQRLNTVECSCCKGTGRVLKSNDKQGDGAITE